MIGQPDLWVSKIAFPIRGKVKVKHASLLSVLTSHLRHVLSLLTHLHFGIADELYGNRIGDENVNMNYEALLRLEQSQEPLFTGLKDKLSGIERSAAGLHATATMDTKVQAHDDHTSGSGSDLSNLSALENGTDTFGQEILRHERDVRRLKELSSRPQAFRKARPRPRIAAPRPQEGFANGVAKALTNGQDNQRAGGSGSNDSDPPLNVPREWGRKAKRNNDWLKKIHAPTMEDVRQKPAVSPERKPDEDAIVPHRTAYTGDEYFSPPRDGVKQSVESPSSLRHMNSTLKEIMDSEDQDFTAADLLQSTPAATRSLGLEGGRGIDELTRLEIQNLERQGVTSRHLDQITERSPNGALRRSSSTRLRALAQADAVAARGDAETRPQTAPASQQRPTRIPRRKSLIGVNKENAAPNSTDNERFKSTQTVKLTQRTSQPVTFRKAQRPGHARTDSMDILRKLARVSSLSPSPAAKDKGQSDKQARHTEQKGPSESPDAQESPLPLSAKSANSDYVFVGKPGDAQSDQLPLESPLEADEEAEELPVPEAEQDLPDIDVTPAPQEQPFTAKTPVVTGAWVDTPKPLTDLRPLLQTTDSTIVRAFGTPSGAATLEPKDSPIEDHVRRTFSEPIHPKSALEAVVQEARDHPDSQLGETTIQSLEDIIHPDMDATDTTLNVNVGGMAQEILEQLDEDREMTQAEKDRRQESLAMEAMNKHLRNARTSIKDANRGMRRVEHRVDAIHGEEATASPAQPNANKGKPPESGAQEQQILLTGGRRATHCPTCGGYTSIWRALLSEFRSCFYTWPPPTAGKKQYLPALTWLGLFCLAWFAWYVVESTLCYNYCHPLYAEKMIDYGVDMDAPRFPFVIPTLFFRPLRPIWKPAFEALGEAFIVFANAAFGWEVAKPEPWPIKPANARVVRDAFAGTYDAGGDHDYWMSNRWAGNTIGSAASTTVATMASVTTRIGGSLGQAVDDWAGSMWDDEVLL